MNKIEFKNRDSQNPNRKKIKIISQFGDTMIADIERDDGASEVGTPINAEIMNNFQEIIATSEENSISAKLVSEQAKSESAQALAKANTAEATANNASQASSVALSKATEALTQVVNKQGTIVTVNNEYKANFTNNDIVDIVYPVGSIYMSVNSISPETLFGGVWERIMDKFLLGAGSTFLAGSIGGEASHTLTISEMPSHTHTQNEHTHEAISTSEGEHIHHIYNSGLGEGYDLGFWPVKELDTSTNKGWSNSKTSSAGLHNHTIVVESATATNKKTGGGVAHNNMPPYLAVYMWKRSA